MVTPEDSPCSGGWAQERPCAGADILFDDISASDISWAHAPARDGISLDTRFSREPMRRQCLATALAVCLLGVAGAVCGVMGRRPRPLFLRRGRRWLCGG